MSLKGDTTSSSLLRRVQAGEEHAWERLAIIYVPLVEGWARRARIGAESIPDLLQEVFATVAVRITDFRLVRGQGTFRGWLWQILRYKIGDHLRALKAEPRAIGGNEGLSPIDLATAPSDDTSDAPAAGLSSACQRALALVRSEFEPRSWQMFWSVAVDEREAAEVAAEHGVKPSAVYTAKCRILRRLREELGDLEA